MSQAKTYIIVSVDPYKQPAGAGVKWSPKHKAWIQAQMEGHPGPSAKPTLRRRPVRKIRTKKKKGNTLDTVVKIAFILLVIILAIALILN